MSCELALLACKMVVLARVGVRQLASIAAVGGLVLHRVKPPRNLNRLRSRPHAAWGAKSAWPGHLAQLGALRIAARFFDRSGDTKTFKRGMDAYNNPGFYRQLEGPWAHASGSFKVAGGQVWSARAE